MRNLTALLALAAALSGGSIALAQEDGPASLQVQAISVSDPTLLTQENNCAILLRSLLVQGNYKLTVSTALQGPPGVFFMLENPKRHLVLLKCGSSGSHGGGEHPI